MDDCNPHSCTGCAHLLFGARHFDTSRRFVLGGHIACSKRALTYHPRPTDGKPAGLTLGGIIWIREQWAFAPFRCVHRLDVADLMLGCAEGDNDECLPDPPKPDTPERRKRLANKAEAERERRKMRKTSAAPCCEVCGVTGAKRCRWHRGTGMMPIETVLAIRHDRKVHGMTYGAIGARHGITAKRAEAIVAGRRYGWVQDGSR